LSSLNSCSNSTNAIVGTQWNFGDPASGASNTSTLLNPSHTFSAIGTYSVRLILNLGCYSDTLIQPVVVNGFTVNTSSIPATCNSSNGTATATPAVAGTYSWLWSNGATTQTATGLSAGTYTVAVTSSTGCISNATVVVTNSGGMNLTVTPTHVSCFGTATGAAAASVMGGTAPYSYLWSNGATTATASNLAANTYTITATDATGCITNQSVTINQPTQLTVVANPSLPTCAGGTGSATTNVSGGTAPYTYLWSNGATTAGISAIANGTYTVTVKDFKNCTLVKSVTVSQPATLTATTTPSPVTCNGASTGSATVSVSGGTAPYSYLWSNGATTATINGLAAATYTLTITDALGCTLSKTAVITQPLALTATITTTPVTCNGASTGSATVSVSGGTAPYSYLWNNGSTTATISGLAAATYTVTITDAGGCSLTKSTTLTQPAAIAVTTSVTSATCGMPNGSATASAPGGTAPYSYSWNTTPVQTTAIATGLNSGIYTVTVTSATGCTSTATASISNTGGLSVSATVTAQINCFGAGTGSLSATAAGGTSPYSYLWSNGAIGSTASGLVAGNYTVTVTDASGCSAGQAVSITEPAQLVVTTTALPANCFGAATGSASVSVSGGTTPYAYLWSNGATGSGVNLLSSGNYTITITDSKGCMLTKTVAITQPLDIILSATSTPALCGGSNGSATVVASGGTGNFSYSWNSIPAQTTATATGLGAGTYTVLVSDAGNCSKSKSIPVVTNGGLNVSASINSQVSCSNGNDGSASALANGGTAPYTYSWSNGTSGNTISGLQAGNYTVTASDTSGCSAVSTITIIEPTPITASITSVPVMCFGIPTGSATVNASGGSGSFTYTWNNGINGATAANLGAGTYSVTITDINNCSINQSTTITSPTQLQVLESHTDISCAGLANGSVTLTASGGSGSYSANWSDGTSGLNISGKSAGNYSYILTDASGCSNNGSVNLTAPASLQTSVVITPASCFGNSDGAIDLSISGGSQPYSISWNMGSTSEDLSNQAAGSYTVEITDSAGCISNLIATITQPDSIAFSYGVTGSACNSSNGTLLFSTSGGQAPYQYSLDGGSFQTSPFFGSLTVGQHTVSIKDGGGCTKTGFATVPSPAGISVTAMAITGTTCFATSDGAAQASVSGGVPPFQITWSSGEAGNQASQLPPGSNNVSVTDALGCNASYSFSVTEPAPLSISASSTPVSCYGISDGAISTTISGGTGAYSIVWNNGASTPSIQGIGAGYYEIQVTDGNSCQFMDTFELSQPLQPILIQTSVIPGSCGTGGGTISVSVQGGSQPYTYSWNSVPVQNDPIAGDLTPGSYSVLVTDSNGCTATATATLPNLPPVAISVDSVRNVSCYGGVNGKVFLTVSGGSLPYHYQWGTGIQAQVPDSLSAGTYTMTVIDSNGCSGQINFTIGQPLPFIANASSQNASCFGLANGRALLQVTGGTQPWTFSWSNGTQTSANNNLVAGTYSCIVTDLHGCTASTSTTVDQPTALQANLDVIQPNCNGTANGQITISASGGTAPYSYQWSNGSSSAQISGLGSGIYTVNIIDQNGCLLQQSSSLQSVAAFDVEIKGDTIICVGEQTLITAFATGIHNQFQYSWTHGVTGEEFAANPTETTTYYVTVTDSTGCSNSESVTIHVNSKPELMVSAEDSSGCAPFCAKMRVQSPTATQFQWTFSNGEILIGTNVVPCFSDPGNYNLTVVATDANQCRSSYSWPQTINVHPLPEAAFTSTPIEASLENPTIQFANQSAGATQYSYYFGDPNQSSVMLPNTAFTYSDTGSFEVSLQVSNEFGCSDNALQTIHIGGFMAFYLPKAFSPNKDGLNDLYMPKASGMAPEGFEMRIYDRWGNEIFFSNQWDKGWDGTYMGKPVQVDLYVCKVKYFDKRGNSSSKIEAVTVTE
jgi:gliding motility-associated-like protein